MDQFFASPAAYITNVCELVKSGHLATAVVDQRVREVLRVKMRLGLFDQPDVPNSGQADKTVHTAADEAFALQVNRESLGNRS